MSIPIQSRLPKTYRIKAIRRETEMVRTYVIDGSVGARPGQFVMCWLPGVDEKPLSVALDTGAEIHLTFFAVGPMTEKLAECKVGDLVGLRGPFGTTYKWSPGMHVALVAGGYGAAPMYFVAKESVLHGCTMEAIVGARGAEHLLYLKELESLPHVSLHVATNDGSVGHKGFNVDILKKMLAVTQDPSTNEKPIDAVFACGPERMLKAVLDACDAHNVPCQLALERYMKCGYGLCGNCVLDPDGTRLCIEGPVVSGDIARKVLGLAEYHRDGMGRRVAW